MVIEAKMEWSWPGMNMKRIKIKSRISIELVNKFRLDKFKIKWCPLQNHPK
jgi:hypothetical protein